MINPKFKRNEKVDFVFDGNSKTMTGIISVVDPNGYLGSSTGNPSYDIFCDGCMYKHVDEDYIKPAASEVIS